MKSFKDRREAGRMLGRALTALRKEHPVVLALPRGGVPVAAEVAAALGAPLDVIVVRKLGVPGRPEFAFGALGEGGVRVIDRTIVEHAEVSAGAIEEVTRHERAELDRRVERYRDARDPVELRGRTVVVVDDGLATGSTARAALQVARARGAARVVLAVPVAPPDTVADLGGVADEVVALVTPARMVAVGQWYQDFTATSDEEVTALLGRGDATGADAPVAEVEVEIPSDGVAMLGSLAVPPRALGVVLFAHGSGSSRHSPRNRAMATAMRAHGLGTLLFDLLTAAEADDRRQVFDIELLTERLLAATTWALHRPETRGRPLGYLGASTGGGAALAAAAEAGNPVRAVVSRGGRPDLAGPRLAHVRCPTLLVVGGADTTVLELNRRAAEDLHCPHRVEVVPGATHLFEEPGALDAVTRLAISWFEHYLPEHAAAHG